MTRNLLPSTTLAISRSSSRYVFHVNVVLISRRHDSNPPQLSAENSSHGCTPCKSSIYIFKRSYHACSTETHCNWRKTYLKCRSRYQLHQCTQFSSIWRFRNAEECLLALARHKSFASCQSKFNLELESLETIQISWQYFTLSASSVSLPVQFSSVHKKKPMPLCKFPNR